MIKPYTFVKNGSLDGEEEIDLAKLFMAILKKWKLLILLGIIGLIVGLPIGYIKGQTKLDEDMLSPLVKKQIDTFYEQELLNEKLNAEADDSFVMSLDESKQYYTATVEYVVRTNEREDAALADSVFNIKSSNEYLNQLSKITGYNKNLDTLAVCVGYSSKLSEQTALALGDVKSNAQASLDFTYSVSYLTQDQLTRFIAYLEEYVANRAAQCEVYYEGFRINQVHDQALAMNAGTISNTIQSIRNSQVARSVAADNSYKAYITELKKNDSKIKDEVIDNYNLYWASLTDPENEESLSKGTVAKWMLIVGVVFGFLGVCWYGVKGLVGASAIDEDALRNTYGLSIIGYNPAGRKLRKGIDGALDAVCQTLKPTSDAYIADVVSSVMAEEEVADAVIICTDEERVMPEMMAAIKAKASGKTVCGNILTESEVLAAAKSAGGVFVITEIDKTRENTLEAELHMVADNGLKMLGVVAI